jgi:hypothetical protein
MIAADTFCHVCGECPADCIYMGGPKCYLCRERTAKAIREKAARIEQEALLAVTREAACYVDGEQAAYYSGTPTECIGFASRGCQCGGCMAREYRSNHRY